jgi:hypothetical protein
MNCSFETVSKSGGPNFELRMSDGSTKPVGIDSDRILRDPAYSVIIVLDFIDAHTAVAGDPGLTFQSNIQTGRSRN